MVANRGQGRRVAFIRKDDSLGQVSLESCIKKLGLPDLPPSDIPKCMKPGEIKRLRVRAPTRGAPALGRGRGRGSFRGGRGRGGGSVTGKVAVGRGDGGMRRHSMPMGLS